MIGYSDGEIITLGGYSRYFLKNHWYENNKDESYDGILKYYGAERIH